MRGESRCPRKAVRDIVKGEWEYSMALGWIHFKSPAGEVDVEPIKGTLRLKEVTYPTLIPFDFKMMCGIVYNRLF